MGSPFTARFQGKCFRCNENINIGDSIKWNRKIKGQTFHPACYDLQFPGKELPGDGHQDIIETKELVPVGNGAVVGPVVGGSDAGATLARLVAPYLTTGNQLDENRVREIAEKAVQDLVTPVIKIEVRGPTGEVVPIEGVHPLFERLLYIVGKGHNVYLWGPAGSGKSTAAKQCSTALKLDWGYIALNPQTPESRLLGFIDATGVYRKTEFRRRYEDGGVFCIDEMDNASAGLVTTLNSGLENGHMAFADGVIARHKNFILVATGNTNGRGGNAMFPERRPFDAAFAERFTFIRWDYDELLEKNIALSINKGAVRWLEWVQRVRAYCLKNHPRVLVSPRASFKGASYIGDNKLSAAEIAEMVVFKGVDADTVNKIVAAVPLPL